MNMLFVESTQDKLMNEMFKSLQEMRSDSQSQWGESEMSEGVQDESYGPGPSHVDFLLEDLDSKDDGNEEEEVQILDESMGIIEDILQANNARPEYGPALRPKVALSFNQLPQVEAQKDSIEKRREIYLVPENARFLGVPRVNPEVWRALSSKVRANDGRLQFTQQHSSRALVALSRVADRMTQLVEDKKISSDEVRLVFTPLMDAATEIGLAHRELSSRRRAQLKSSYPLVAPLCYPSIPVTELLFGDNFESDLRSGMYLHMYIFLK
jgi:phage tail protein X